MYHSVFRHLKLLLVSDSTQLYDICHFVMLFSYKHKCNFLVFFISAANAGATSEYSGLTADWLKKAEEEENRRGSVYKLYTLLEGRFVSAYFHVVNQ